MHIIPFIILVIPMAMVFFFAHQWATQEDKANNTIRTSAMQVGFDENGYFPAHNGTEEWIYVGSICDPQPFNWASDLHMMLPNQLTAYIQEDK